MTSAADRLRAIGAALDAARVPASYRAALLAELEDHAAAHAEARRAEGATSDEAWREAIAALGAPAALATAAAAHSRKAPYRWPFFVLVAAPALLALVASPGLSALVVTPLLPSSQARPDWWLVPLISALTALVGASLTVLLGDVRRRYTGLARQTWLGTALVVLACASFSTSVLVRGEAVVVRARYGWPLAYWQSAPALVLALRSRRSAGAVGRAGG